SAGCAARRDRLPRERHLARGRRRLPPLAAGFAIRAVRAMTGRHVFFEGRVQGVGFRWTVKNLARGYDVTGWVKNLPDGRVEMQASGETGEVDAFIEAIGE